MSKDWDQLSHFLNGLAAATQLAVRAAENGFTIEYIVLAASIIDGVLRIGLVLHHQIETKSSEIPKTLVLQEDADKAISERQIYRRALSAGVIDEIFFNELQELYDARNRVIHRYIISDITTEKVLKIGFRYDKAIQKANKFIWDVEERQIRLGVGMTRSAKKGEHSADFEAMTRAKHGVEWLSQALKRKKAT